MVPQTEKGSTIPRPPPDNKMKFAMLRDRLAVLHAIKEREYSYSESAGLLFDKWHITITKRIDKAEPMIIPFYLKMRDIFIHKLCILSAFERNSSIISDSDLATAAGLLWPIEKGWQEVIAKFTEKEWDRETERVILFLRKREKCDRTEILRACRGIRGQKLTAILTGLQQDKQIIISEKQTEGRTRSIIEWTETSQK